MIQFLAMPYSSNFNSKEPAASIDSAGYNGWPGNKHQQHTLQLPQRRGALKCAHVGSGEWLGGAYTTTFNLKAARPAAVMPRGPPC